MPVLINEDTDGFVTDDEIWTISWPLRTGMPASNLALIAARNRLIFIFISMC